MCLVVNARRGDSRPRLSSRSEARPGSAVSPAKAVELRSDRTAEGRLSPRGLFVDKISIPASPRPMAEKRTLFEKVWDEHVVSSPPDRLPLLYIDLHLVHEVTSPQAFDGLRAAGRRVRQPNRTVATVDHNIPTEPRGTPITDPDCRPPDPGLAEELQGIRRPAVRHGFARPGHRARHRPRTWTHPAGHDHRLRRQPHQHAWRIRRAGIRHRHVGSRARAGHAMPAAAQAEDHADQRARVRSPKA